MLHIRFCSFLKFISSHQSPRFAGLFPLEVENLGVEVEAQVQLEG